MVRYAKQYPLGEFVTHRFGLTQVDDAMKKSMAADSMKVVIDPWS
jgi:Zn-dependent alcohol dehydrogenase